MLTANYFVFLFLCFCKLHFSKDLKPRHLLGLWMAQGKGWGGGRCARFNKTWKCSKREMTWRYYGNHCSKAKVKMSSLLIFRKKCRVFFLGKEKCQCVRSRILTHFYHRARLPRDPDHPLLRCLSEQKQALALLWRFDSPIMTTHELCFNRELLCRERITEISTSRKDTSRWVSGVLGRSFDELTPIIWPRRRWKEENSICLTYFRGWFWGSNGRLNGWESLGKPVRALEWGSPSL